MHQYLGYTEDKVSDECRANLQEQIDYLGPIDVLMYYNDEKYQINEYGDKSILRESVIV